MLNIKKFLANLPHRPGTYQMLGEKDEVLYVGKAKNLKKRLASYFTAQQKDPKTLLLLRHVRNIDITVTHSENEAVILEFNLIKKHHPRYNVLLRDDKSYPYIVITQEHPFPRIDIYRGARKKHGQYFGPYPNATAARETLHLLQKIFRLRTCTDSFYAARSRPCLHYQIGRCSGPCTEMISQQAYQENVHHAVLFLRGKSDEVIKALQKRMEGASISHHYELAAHFRDQIARLRQIQERQYVDVGKGEADVIALMVQAGVACIQLLSIRGGRVLGSRSYFPRLPTSCQPQEILQAFITQHYLLPTQVDNIPKEIILNITFAEQSWLSNVLSEQAKHQVKFVHPLRGERKKWLEIASSSAKQSLIARIHQQSNLTERFLALQKALDLPEMPYRLECFDISHSMGEATVASCVVLDHQGAVKNDYRRFNITDITPGSDTAAMQQVVYRRFKRLQKESARLPDIILIDGGPTQVAAAQHALDELAIQGVLLIGVAKGVARKPGQETLHIPGRPPLKLSPDSPALHLIQQIRDEAHRFAITGHRQRRAKARQQSRLDNIPGIGEKRRRELLRYFGGIQGVTHASLEELLKVPGINHSIAERLFASLHDEDELA